MPTTSINWPEQLRDAILQDSYQLTPTDPLLRTDMSDGRSFQRRRYMSTPMTVSLNLLFTEGQYMLFESFFTYDLNDGVNWFNAPIKTALGYDDYMVRMTQVYKSATPQQGRFWSVTAEAELYKRPVLDRSWSDVVPDFVANMSIFDEAMCREWPKA